MEKLYVKVRPYFWLMAVVALGIWMLLAPELFEGYHVRGKNGFFKMIFRYLWGVPAGVALIVASVGLGIHQLRSSRRKTD